MPRFPLHCLPCLCLATAFTTLQAEDLTTNSGKVYHDIHDVLIRGDTVSFSTDTDIVKISINDLPLALQSKYLDKSSELQLRQKTIAQQAAVETAAKNNASREQIIAIGNQCILAIADGMKSVQTNGPAVFSDKNTWSMAQLADAKKMAAASGRPIGFLLVGANLLGTPCDPLKTGPQAALAHLFAAFNKGLILIFVRGDVEADYKALPASVQEILGQPSKNFPVPRLIITDPLGNQPLLDLQIGPNDDVKSREKLIFAAATKIKQWYAAMVNIMAGG